ncbi:hypothetical protein BGW39_010398 [Mortierella sp. 14UC]|nr:hypothetical protein BGW39_010398 [Mortierella sp. 14UC]
MTRRLLTISFSLFLVSAMMGSFPIPGTNSVSIPSSSSVSHLESPLPSSTAAVSIAANTIAALAAGTGTSTDATPAINSTEALSSASPLSASSINAPATSDPNVIRILKSENPTAASSGFYRASISLPLEAKQPGGSPQPKKRDATAQTATPSAFGRPPQQGQQYQQWQQLGGQQGAWTPSQGSQQQWYPLQQGGQQWWIDQGGQQQQQSPPLQSSPSQQGGQQWGGGQQWYSQQGGQQGQQLGKPYSKPIKKRAITVGTSTPTMGATSNTAAPHTYRMSALVCNVDTAVRGLLHCSDNQDYYTLEQPANPANSADPRNRPAWPPTAPFVGTGTRPLNRPVMKRAVTYSQPQAQGALPAGVEQGRGAFDTLSSNFFTPSAYHTTTPEGVAPQGWFRHPQPYASQPQSQTQPQVESQQEEGAKVSKRNAEEATAAANQAGAASQAAAVDAALCAAAESRSRDGFDTGNLSKWSGGGSGGGSYDGDDWPSSHYGKGKKGSGKKWNKRSGGGGDIEDLTKWSGSSGSEWGSGEGYDGDWGSPSDSDKKWYKRQVGSGFGPAGAGAGRGGPGGAYVVGNNNPAIPVPIDVQLLWDGSNVNVVTPSGVPAGPGGPGGLGGPGGIAPSSSTGGPVIPVPINVDALVYPDGQMQVFPSGAGGI